MLPKIFIVLLNALLICDFNLIRDDVLYCFMRVLILSALFLYCIIIYNLYVPIICLSFDYFFLYIICFFILFRLIPCNKDLFTILLIHYAVSGCTVTSTI